ncbi:uncharacterized protein LOC143908521 [Temnothorax americanus]|uniref:uncharacterized protein LOC143908521 n=1 Tax=Temnothorax americanus TaxID=1964332 RepID=UPI0040693A58
MELSKAITKEADSDILFQKSSKERTLKMRKERGMENSIQSDSEKEHKPKRKKMEENDTEESVDNNFTNREPQICDVTENKSTTDLLPKTKEMDLKLDKTRVQISNAKFCESADSVSDTELSNDIEKENCMHSDNKGHESKKTKKMIDENGKEECTDIISEHTKLIQKLATDILPKTKKTIITKVDRQTQNEQEKKLNKQIVALQNENAELRQLLKKNTEELEETKTRNIALQVRVVNEFDEFRNILKEVVQKNQLPTQENNNELFAVGYRRIADNTIHIGRDIWLSCPMYDSIIQLSRSKAQFVKNCAIAVFGTTSLKESTVTGTVSNRIRNKTLVVPRQKLDATKLLALKDIFRHVLKTKYNLNEVAIELELTRVGTYVSQKIYELNRSCRVPSGIKKVLRDIEQVPQN